MGKKMDTDRLIRSNCEIKRFVKIGRHFVKCGEILNNLQTNIALSESVYSVKAKN